MTVVVREGDQNPPVFATGEATSVCFYDETGSLVRAVCIIPGSGVMMTTTKGDDDFRANIDQLKIPATL